jgi:L-methionine (R)-S-oxide reductase
MAEVLVHVSGSRKEKYDVLIPQLQTLVAGETDLIANLANIAAAIKETFGFLWVGFYLVKEDALVLGPFQGPIACTRIARGRGVCGTAWEKRESILVGDVNSFEGHIACSSLSKSELVVPLRDPDGDVWGVLDLDSALLNEFSETDKNELEHFFQWFCGQL